MTSKVFIALDVKNLLRVCKGLFGNSYRMDYDKLLKSFAADCESGANIKAVAFVSQARRISHADLNFTTALVNMGYELERQIIMPRIRLGLDIMSETDWCAGIAALATKKAILEGFDTIIVVTGDNDYRHMCKILSDQGIKTGVYTFAYPPALYEGCARFVRQLNKDYVYSVSKRRFEEEEDDR